MRKATGQHPTIKGSLTCYLPLMIFPCKRTFLKNLNDQYWNRTGNWIQQNTSTNNLSLSNHASIEAIKECHIEIKTLLNGPPQIWKNIHGNKWKQKIKREWLEIGTNWIFSRDFNEQRILQSDWTSGLTGHTQASVRLVDPTFC